MKSNWNYPTTVWTGENRVEDIAEACLISKIKNPLFVTDKDLITLPMTNKIIDNLIKVFKDKNIPFMEIEINNIKEDVLGLLFSYFILETVLISKILNINPYNQPAVEEVKLITKKILSR